MIPRAARINGDRPTELTITTAVEFVVPLLSAFKSMMDPIARMAQKNCK